MNSRIFTNSPNKWLLKFFTKMAIFEISIFRKIVKIIYIIYSGLLKIRTRMCKDFWWKSWVFEVRILSKPLYKIYFIKTFMAPSWKKKVELEIQALKMSKVPDSVQNFQCHKWYLFHYTVDIIFFPLFMRNKNTSSTVRFAC